MYGRSSSCDAPKRRRIEDRDAIVRGEQRLQVLVQHVGRTAELIHMIESLQARAPTCLQARRDHICPAINDELVERSNHTQDFPVRRKLERYPPVITRLRHLADVCVIISETAIRSLFFLTKILRVAPVERILFLVSDRDRHGNPFDFLGLQLASRETPLERNKYRRCGETKEFDQGASVGVHVRRVLE